MTIEIIELDETQITWVNAENVSGDFNAPICDYIDVDDVAYNNCIDAIVLTLTGYEAWATYLDGVTVTEIEISTAT